MYGIIESELSAIRIGITFFEQECKMQFDYLV